MAKNRLAQQRSPELPKFNNPPLNQQLRRPVAPIQPSPRLKNQTLNERRKRVNPTLHHPLPWYQLIGQLIVKRPLLLLLTFCGGMLIIAGLAVIGLTRPEQAGKLKSQPTPTPTSVTPTTETAAVTESPTSTPTPTSEASPSPTPTVENPPATTTVTPQTESNSPLGLYLLVGAGCGLGAWLLYRRRLKLGGKRRRKPFPKLLSSTIQGKTPEKPPNNRKPARRNAPGSRKPLVASPGKIPVADSIVRWPNGQTLPRNSQKLIKDTTAKRRQQSLSSASSSILDDR
jgi:hypothetical protein